MTEILGSAFIWGVFWVVLLNVGCVLSDWFERRGL